MLLLKFEGSY